MAFDELAKQHFKDKREYHQAIGLSRQFTGVQAQYSNSSDIEDHFLINLDDYEMHLLSLIGKLNEQRQIRFGSKELTLTAEQQAGFNTLAKVANASKLKSKSLESAIDDFLTDRKQNWNPSGGTEDTYRTEVFPLFIEAIGQPGTGKLQEHHAILLKAAVLKLPKKNRRKMPEYRELSLQQLSALPIPEDKQISSRTKSY